MVLCSNFGSAVNGVSGSGVRGHLVAAMKVMMMMMMMMMIIIIMMVVVVVAHPFNVKPHPSSG